MDCTLSPVFKEGLIKAAPRGEETWKWSNMSVLTNRLVDRGYKLLTHLAHGGIVRLATVEDTRQLAL